MSVTPNSFTLTAADYAYHDAVTALMLKLSVYGGVHGVIQHQLRGCLFMSRSKESLGIMYHVGTASGGLIALYNRDDQRVVYLPPDALVLWRCISTTQKLHEYALYHMAPAVHDTNELTLLESAVVMHEAGKA